jgi:hypothetical protein
VIPAWELDGDQAVVRVVGDFSRAQPDRWGLPPVAALASMVADEPQTVEAAFEDLFAL